MNHSSGTRDPALEIVRIEIVRTDRHRLNGYLVLQANIHFRTSQSKHILKLLARKRLGTRWAKYPFSRCRTDPVRKPAGSRLSPALAEGRRLLLRGSCAAQGSPQEGLAGPRLQTRAIMIIINN